MAAIAMRLLVALLIVVAGLAASSTARADATITDCTTINLAGFYAVTADLPPTLGCINVVDVTNVTVDCGEHEAGYVSISNSVNVTIQNCVFDRNTTLSMKNTRQSTVTENTFTADGTAVFGSQIEDIGGQFNRITFNSLNGAATRVPTTLGSDDGIVIKANVVGDQVTDNIITDMWDAGIETLGLVSKTLFARNTISDTPYGIGGWYWSSWEWNAVADNRVDNAWYGLMLFNTFGAADSGTTVYFTDNLFSGNVFTNITYGSNIDAYDINPPYLDAATSKPMPDGTVETTVASGNVLENNVWGGPLMVYPPSAFAPTTTTTTTSTTSTTSTTTTTVGQTTTTTTPRPCHGNGRHCR